MNYDFLLETTGLDSDAILLVENIKIPQQAKPHVGDVIALPGYPNREYDIIRSLPTNNPNTQKVQFFVRNHIDKVQQDNPQEQIEGFY